MVDIISRSDGPRRQDETAKHFIYRNQSTITGLADQLTQGAYSAGKRQKQARDAAAQRERETAANTPSLPASARDSGDIRVKVSVNNRVVAYDTGSGRQVLLLGEIRRKDGLRYFALASKDNGFFAPPPDEVTRLVHELDGQIIDAACPEKLLAAEIAERLGYR